MNKVRVGVLRGGPNKNYENSLREGQDMLACVDTCASASYIPVDVFIDRDGVWHTQGIPVLPMDLFHKVDLIWDTTMPACSQVLEGHIPLLKNPHFASTIVNDKSLLRKHMETIGVEMSRHVVLPVYQEDFDGPIEDYAAKKAVEVHAKFGAPWIVKSFTHNPDEGIHVAKTFPELMRAIEDLLSHKESILVEELILGKRGGVHTIAGFRGDDLYHMLPYETRINEIQPVGNFSDVENQKIYDLSENIFKHLGAENYLHFNFVIDKRGGIHVTEASLLPDFKEEEVLSHSARTVGSHRQEVFEHMLKNAMSR